MSTGLSYTHLMTDECFVIVNLLAGRGRCRRLWPSIERALSRLPFRHVFTQATGAATEIARRAAKDFSTIVAVGGDGTIHEVAAGLMGSQAKLGIIPAGTGNDFVKMLDIPPKDPIRAIEILTSGLPRRVDVGRVGERYFVNGLGVGLDGAVAWRVFRSWRWPALARWIYLYAAIREALFFRSSDIEIVAPDWRASGRLMMVGASNGRYHGGDFLLVPHAQVDDGLFDVYMIADMSPFRRLREIPKTRRGEHISLPEVQIRRAPWVEILTEQPLLGHLDGEPTEFSAGRLRVELLPKALEVIGGG
ncbi:MAG: diacylglycerol kinase family lipid kinase [Candidatus Bipolaricaulota bacterium]|nr:diacylglycerol kinase family lipid kinase [Candidatus Bipolaricaulota bacterium]